MRTRSERTAPLQEEVWGNLPEDLYHAALAPRILADLRHRRRLERELARSSLDEFVHWQSAELVMSPVTDDEVRRLIDSLPSEYSAIFSIFRDENDLCLFINFEVPPAGAQLLYDSTDDDDFEDVISGLVQRLRSWILHNIPGLHRKLVSREFLLMKWLLQRRRLT